MLVVLPVCQKDAEAAVRNLQWAIELDGRANCRCLISTEMGMDVERVAELARSYFSEVQIYRYGQFPRYKPAVWPHPQNWAWRHAALQIGRMANREHWLWWEQDAVPLKAGWLRAIDEGYAIGGKPFMGALGAVPRPEWHAHLNGVAVYPPDLHRYAPQSMFYGLFPFDVAGGWRVMNEAFISPLFQHVWSFEGNTSQSPPSFPEKSYLNRMSRDAVLFHRCKDGTLIDQIRRSTLPLEPRQLHGIRMRRRNEGTKVTVLQQLLRKTKNASTKIELTPGLEPVTVVITNFQRADMLWQAWQSAKDAGVHNVVVSSSGANSEVRNVLKRIARKDKRLQTTVRDDDAGCNETWLRGVRMAKTKWVHILHDDDLILPSFYKLASLIKEYPDIGFFHWNGAKHGVASQGVYETFRDKPTAPHSTDILWPFILSPGANSLSPVSGLFRKEHLVDTLVECEKRFTTEEFFYRPKMMVGNDLMIWLKAAEKYPHFFYSREPFISYGHWEGSCSYEDWNKKERGLPKIYDATRHYYFYGPPYSPVNSRPLIHIKTTFGAGTPAVDFATKIWTEHYRRARWFLKPISDSDMPRLFSDGKRKVPYLKDMVAEAMKKASDDAIFVLTNSDIIPCDSLTGQLLDAFETHEAAYCFRRDMKDLTKLTPQQIRINTMTYAGVDMIAFTADWWRKYEPRFPDLLFATEAWDYAMRLFMDRNGGKRFYYLIYHQAHVAEGIRNRDSLSQQYNRNTVERFLKDHNGVIYWKSQNVNMNPR